MSSRSGIDFRTFLRVRDLRNIRRFNKRILHNNDTVASHSYYVTMLSLMIAERYNEITHSEQVDSSLCMINSLFHDAEECVLGDVITTTKYSNGSMKRAYDELKYEVFKDVMGHNQFRTLIAAMESKGRFSKELVICTLADKIEAQLTCLEEYVLYSNQQFRQIIDKYKLLINNIVNEDKVLHKIYHEILDEIAKSYLNGKYDLNEG